MIKRNTSKTEQAKSRHSKGWRRASTYALMFACGVMLAGGFFFAAQQHFSSMDYGMKNSRLRKQVDELESEKRRLMLAREISLSPSEIKKAAKKAGMIEPVTSEAPVAQLASITNDKPAAPAGPSSKSMVVKTAAVTAVPAAVPVSYSKPMPEQVASSKPDSKAEKVVKQVKKTLPAE
jgi:hypothetical protein